MAMSRRDVEQRVEALARKALGERALHVRAFRKRLEGAADLAAALPGPGSMQVFVAAQVLI